jgi:predicted Rossmann-fold nucleotide-binding protein
VVQSGDIIVALPGEYGTLSEIALALRFKKPVISLGSWDIPGVMQVKTVEEAEKKIVELMSLR